MQLSYAPILLLLLSGPPDLPVSGTPVQMTFEEYKPIILETTYQEPEGWSVLYDWDFEYPFIGRVIDGGTRVHAWAPPSSPEKPYAVELEIVEARYNETTKRIEFQQKEYTFYVQVTPATNVIRPPPVTVTPTQPTQPVNPTLPPPERTLVVVVYESSLMAIPLAVHQARLDLENLNYQVRVIDQDVETGDTREIPREVAPALLKAKEVGLPALVVSDSSADGRVLKAVRLPDTKAAILKEVRP